MTEAHLQHRPLNLIGHRRPWTCSLHGIHCPAGSAGCPACVAEWEAANGRKLGDRCLGVGWVCENHHDRPWGGMCCDWHNTNSGECKHGACGCGAGDPCPDCNPDGMNDRGLITWHITLEGEQ